MRCNERLVQSVHLSIESQLHGFTASELSSIHQCVARLSASHCAIAINMEWRPMHASEMGRLRLKGHWRNFAQLLCQEAMR